VCAGAKDSSRWFCAGSLQMHDCESPRCPHTLCPLNASSLHAMPCRPAAGTWRRTRARSACWSSKSVALPTASAWAGVLHPLWPQGGLWGWLMVMRGVFVDEDACTPHLVPLHPLSLCCPLFMPASLLNEAPPLTLMDGRVRGGSLRARNAHSL